MSLRYGAVQQDLNELFGSGNSFPGPSPGEGFPLVAGQFVKPFTPQPVKGKASEALKNLRKLTWRLARKSQIPLPNPLDSDP